MSRPHDASIAHEALHEKLLRLLRGHRSARETAAADYAGLVVFDRGASHQAGRALGRDFPRVLNELGIGRCDRLFEFCAGPGYIGYALLANGWCETLALSDIDAEAIATAMRTAAYNGLQHRVSGYASDVLDDIPASERWDLVVACPPAFRSHPDGPLAPGDWDRGFDTDWNLRRRFYASIRTHMNPGGVVVMVENLRGSDPDVFAGMIRAGGGEQRAVHVGTDVQGRANGIYYQVSVW